MNTPTTSTQRSDLYTRVTERVMADLERGARPWLRPWTSGSPRITRPRRYNGMPYRGINVLLLWGEAIDRGYSAPLWMTYRQALELGAHVRQGEHGTTVVYADRIVRKDTDDAGHEVERAIPFLKAYTVFNVAQIENLPAQYVTQPEPQADPVGRIASAEAFIAATGATIRTDLESSGRRSAVRGLFRFCRGCVSCREMSQRPLVQIWPPHPDKSGVTAHAVAPLVF